MQTLYKVEEYKDVSSGNLCELFQVIVDGVLVYEREYGSLFQDIKTYVQDYLDYLENKQ